MYYLPSNDKMEYLGLDGQKKTLCESRGNRSIMKYMILTGIKSKSLYGFNAF